MSHTLTTYYVRTGPGAWNVYATLDGANPQTVGAGMTFNVVGSIDERRDGSCPVLSVDHRRSDTVVAGYYRFYWIYQYGSESGVDGLRQGGYTSGALAGITVGSDGVIPGRYSNGQTRAPGQVVLANFTRTYRSG